MNIKQISMEFLKENKIQSLPVNIEAIAESLGYNVLTYSRAAQLCPAYYRHAMEGRRSFSFVIDELFYILIVDDCTPDERRRLITHEIAHYLLHFSSGDILGGTPEKEREADEFMRRVLSPLPALYKLNIKRPADISKLTGLSALDAKITYNKLLEYRSDIDSSRWGRRFTKTKFQRYPLDLKPFTRTFWKIFIGISVAAAFALFWSVISTGEPLSPSEPAGSTSSSAYAEEIVYVTPSGERYHKPDCYHIDKSEVQQITAQEAIEQGYTPCKDCWK